jgi:hypothetical protein
MSGTHIVRMLYLMFVRLARVDGGAGIPDVQGGRESRGKSQCERGTSGFIPPDWRGARLVP